MRLALIGAGRVGTAVSLLLRRSGHEVSGVSSRTKASAERAAAALACPVFDFEAALPECDLVLIGAADPAIPSVAAAVSSFVSPGVVVGHFAGSLGLAPLAPVVLAGAAACALHPVQAIADVDSGLERLPGSAWGLTCAAGLRPWVEDLVHDLGGEPVWVAEGDRPVWHAAAVTTSNGIAALLAAGESMLEAIGVRVPADVLGPLAAGTVANVAEAGGGGRALTGPVARGETATIGLHLEALRAGAPQSLPGYRLVVQMIVGEAARSGRLDPSAEASMRRLLEDA